MFTLAYKDKLNIFLKEMNRLTEHHLASCPPYQRLFTMLNLSLPPYTQLSDVPYLPVSLFKTQELMSISKKEIHKILLSSGTTGSLPSKIFLDKPTSHKQMHALTEIMESFLGSERLPMLIVDSENVIKDPHTYTARGAALLGMMNFGYDPLFLLDSSSNIKTEAAFNWLAKYKDKPFIIFGFTFMIWKHLLKLDLKTPGGIIIHTGGWKRMNEINISNTEFKKHIFEQLGIMHCHNFYGMVEQVGSIFVECSYNRFHTPDYSEVLMRDPITWKESCSGVIQVLSSLPSSYPGHSLLTEDLGVLLGQDDCPCGRLGSTFNVKGRAPAAEIRGCSDVLIGEETI